MTDPYHIQLVPQPLDPATHEAICAPLRDHNRAHNPTWWTARDEPQNAPQPLNLVAFDPAGAVAGGLLAETQFSWLKLAILSVRPDLRRRGLGSRLLATAEAEAIRRGCTYAYADTTDYQAPAFYHRLGYATAGRLDDWDSHGHAKLFLVKRLAPSSPTL
jgi:predicted N-acetyltransferase YhbS